MYRCETLSYVLALMCWLRVCGKGDKVYRVEHFIYSHIPYSYNTLYPPHSVAREFACAFRRCGWRATIRLAMLYALCRVRRTLYAPWWAHLCMGICTTVMFAYLRGWVWLCVCVYVFVVCICSGILIIASQQASKAKYARARALLYTAAELRDNTTHPPAPPHTYILTHTGQKRTWTHTHRKFVRKQKKSMKRINLIWMKATQCTQYSLARAHRCRFHCLLRDLVHVACASLVSRARCLSGCVLQHKIILVR